MAQRHLSHRLKRNRCQYNWFSFRGGFLSKGPSETEPRERKRGRRWSISKGTKTIARADRKRNLYALRNNVPVVDKARY